MFSRLNECYVAEFVVWATWMISVIFGHGYLGLATVADLTTDQLGNHGTGVTNKLLPSMKSGK
jgi:hypothetical protein